MDVLDFAFDRDHFKTMAIIKMDMHGGADYVLIMMLSIRQLTNLLRNLHNNYHIILITATHDVNFVPEVAERIYVLDKGHVIAEGLLRQIFSNPKLMSEANLEPPIVTRLFNALAEENNVQIESIPLTVGEALHELRRCCRFS